MSVAAIFWGVVAGLALLALFAAIVYGVANLIEGLFYDAD